MSYRYYIASGLENALTVRELKAKLDAAGWEHQYDWTVHGSVRSEGIGRLGEVAAEMANGVFTSQIFIALLPGGKGTHAELGMAIGQEQMLNMFIAGSALSRCSEHRVCIVGTAENFDAEKTCAFYFHPFVERFKTVEALLTALKVTP